MLCLFLFILTTNLIKQLKKTWISTSSAINKRTNRILTTNYARINNYFFKHNVDSFKSSTNQNPNEDFLTSCLISNLSITRLGLDIYNNTATTSMWVADRQRRSISRNTVTEMWRMVCVKHGVNRRGEGRSPRNHSF